MNAILREFLEAYAGTWKDHEDAAERIIEVAQAAGASELLSEDLQDGRQFGPVLVTNPFRPG